jgi:hypothetical protein
MAEPVELTREEALDLLQRELRPSEPPATIRERLVGSISLFIAFGFVGILINATLRVARLYEEMDIEGGLPYMTEALVGGARFCATQPLFIAATSLGCSWLHFNFIAGSRRRRRIFIIVLLSSMVVLTLFCASVLYLPLAGIATSIGK